uniref:Cyclin-dependent kinase n=1 Tax=Opuntia streptacantha TaxID=393608 RepID=A0A7C9DWX4_OPUST
MDSIESKFSDDPLNSPAKYPPELKSQPSIQLSADPCGIRTPQKLPSVPRRFKQHRPSELPEKYELMVKFFDALVASLKLLRLRKSIPVFSKIRVMIESMSERRFTHQHLAQLKFLLPELSVKRILLPDDETRCVKYDLHLTLDFNVMINTKKRKRGSKFSPLKDCFMSRLSQLHRAHPEVTEIPEEALPEPFSWQKYAPLLNTSEPSCSVSPMHKLEGLQPAQASHFSASFKGHFSKGGQGNESGIRFQGPSGFWLQSPSVSLSETQTT